MPFFFQNQVKQAGLYCLMSLIAFFFTGNYLLGQENNSFKGLPFISNYGPETYKAGIQNWDIIQDDKGLIYVANNMGLLVFDGRTWTRYGLNNTKVRSAHFGKDGKIYVGSQADFGFITPDQRGQLVYTSLADSLPEEVRDFDETWKVYEIEGKIYFCTFKRVYVYDGNSIDIIQPDSRLEISFQVDNLLYTFQMESGLSVLKGTQFELVRNGDFFKEKRIANVLNYEKGSLLIATVEYGAFLYNNGSINPFQFKGDFWRNDYLINYSTRLRNGNIAIGTQNAGLFIVEKNGELVLHLDKESGLMDLTINYIYEDINGGLWLAMNNGVARVDLNSPFTFIDDRMGLSGSGYTALLQDDVVYLGTNNGLFKWEKGKINFVGGTSGQVYTIQELNGKVLVGHHNGTFIVEGGKAKKIFDENGAWTFKSPPGQPNLVIQGNYTGLFLFEWKNGSLEFKQKIKGFSESSRILEFDGDKLWIAHGYKGVFKLEFNEDFTEVISSKRYDSRSGFPSDVLINVFKISNQLIFTADRGFYRFNETEDKFEPSVEYGDVLTKQTTMVDMESDELGNIYYIEQNKLGVLKLQANNKFENHSSSFNKIRSYWNDDLANVIVLDNYNILIGGKQGFIHYSPEKDIPRTVQPKILFKEIINSGKKDSLIFSGHENDKHPLEAIQDQKFKYSQNSFSFEFVSPHYESGREVLYQYKLENYDENWSAWGYENKKEYTNLREGTYHFVVRAKNIFEEPTEEIRFSFTVAPPFYRSVLAYLFYTFGTIFLLYLAFRWLDKKHKEETLLLEQEQNQALKKKDSEIKSITQRTEEEIVKLKNEKLQNEIEYKNQELTSSAMHLIQKNQLLSNIKNTLKNITKDEKSRQLNSQLLKLIKSIDKDLETGDEWTQFSENFDQVHGNFITRLKEKYPDMTPQEIKFAAYIRMNLNTKEIANLLGISVRGVEIGRYRVRKKLGLERKDNLSDFLLRF